MRLGSWRDHLVDERFANIDPADGIRRIVASKNKDSCQKIGLYLSKYKEKWERTVKKYEDETYTLVV
jgi:hypothetical protein